MLAPLVLALAMASAAASPPLIASQGFTTKDAPYGAAAAYGAHLERKLGEAGLRIVPATTLAARAGEQRWAQLRGCDIQQPECRDGLAEIAGAQAVLFGFITTTRQGLQMQVAVVEARTGRVLGHELVTSAGRFDLTRGLTEAAERLAPRVGEALGVEVSPPMSLSRWGYVPAGVGLAAAAVSTGFFVSAAGKYRTLDQEPQREALTFVEADALRRSGESKQRVGLVLAGVSVASMAGSLVLFYLGAKERPGIVTGLTVSPSQRTLVLSGVLP